MGLRHPCLLVSHGGNPRVAELSPHQTNHYHYHLYDYYPLPAADGQLRVAVIHDDHDNFYITGYDPVGIISGGGGRYKSLPTLIVRLKEPSTIRGWTLTLGIRLALRQVSWTTVD